MSHRGGQGMQVPQCGARSGAQSSDPSLPRRDLLSRISLPRMHPYPIFHPRTGPGMSQARRFPPGTACQIFWTLLRRGPENPARHTRLAGEGVVALPLSSCSSRGAAAVAAEERGARTPQERLVHGRRRQRASRRRGRFPSPDRRPGRLIGARGGASVA